MSWRDERRADRLADAQAQAVLVAATGDQQRRDQQQRTHQARQARLDREAGHRAARDRRRAALGQLRRWLAGHVVDLLIYPLAVVSAAMAVPAMAAWGVQQYNSPTGVLLPAISELGMWAFAVAVQISRHRHPDRSVWALQVGVAVFAATAAGLNFLHGRTGGGWSSGLVMAVVSIAGVAAHQLVTSGARRSRAERDTARAATRVRRHARRYERAALHGAVAQITTSGAVALLVSPGVYRLGRRGRLERASVPGLPVTSTTDDLDHELAALLADHGQIDRPPTTPPGPSIGGPVATLDPPPTPTGSAPDPSPHRSAPDRRGEQHESTPDRRIVPGRAARSIDQLRAELTAAWQADPTAVDPTSAESIRRALHCSPRSARRLRDEWSAR